MRQDSRKTAENMITMEEYLKKRQAIKRQEAAGRVERTQSEDALKMAEILYV